MIRHKPLRRSTVALRRSQMPKRGKVRDPVTPAVYAAVLSLDDGRCAATRAGLPGDCDGPLELDHVVNAGHGRRGPSVAGNLVALCRQHHRYKTEHANVSRPLLLAWIASRAT